MLEVLLSHLQDVAGVGEEDVAAYAVPSYGGYKLELLKGLWSGVDTFGLD